MAKTKPTELPSDMQGLIDKVYETESSIRALAYRALKSNSGRTAERCYNQMMQWEGELRTSLLPSLTQHLPQLTTTAVTVRTSTGEVVEVDCSGTVPLCRIVGV